MPTGRAAGSGSLYSTNGCPTTVICPTAARLVSVNHRFKFGGEPDAMPFGSDMREGVTCSDDLTAVKQLPHLARCKLREP